MKKDIDAISRLNFECFGMEDDYTPVENISMFIAYSSGHYLLHRVKDRVVGYLLYTKEDSHYKGVRLGVAEDQRRKGIAVALCKKVIALARKDGKPFKTYTSFNNISSLNAHIKSGMRIEHIDEWVHITS